MRTNSGLQIGQKITFVNGARCPTSTMDVLALLSKHKNVSIIAVDLAVDVATQIRNHHANIFEEAEEEMFLATVEKPSGGHRLGIAFHKCRQTNAILIAGISENGFFAEPD